MRVVAIVRTAIWLTGCFVMLTATSRTTVAEMPNTPTGVEAKSAEQPSAPAPPIKPDYTNQRQFGFPVSIDPLAIGVATLQLHASTNRGRTWQLYSEQPAHIKSFPVWAKRDGEYWFAVKTIDLGNNVRPAGDTTVQRIVIVDSRKPKIELSAEPLTDGQVRIRWQISDPHLDEKSLKVGYQCGGGQWQLISVDANSRIVSEGVIAGEYSWTPQTTSRVVNLRIEISDLAKNRAVEARQLFLPRIAKSRSSAQAAEATAKNENVSTNAGKTAVDNTAPSPPPVRAGTSWPVNNQLPLKNENDVANNNDKNPTTGDGYGQLASQVNPQVQDEASDVSETPTNTANKTSDETDETSTSEPSSEPSPSPDSDYRWPKIPPGEPLRMTQSRRFHLDYDIESLGPDVVSEVQLWGTQDGGLTWEKWNIDHDKQSPFDVQVNEEGLYGFRVVIIANNGLAGEVPSPGAPADLWVGYDATRPTAQITDVIYGSGPHLGQLDIRWTAADRRLGERPVALAFAASPEGPWTTIASALPNTGQYYWEVDATVPKQIYLKLECFDEAGNSCSNITHDPVKTAGVFPRARIRAVQPVE